VAGPWDCCVDVWSACGTGRALPMPCVCLECKGTGRAAHRCCVDVWSACGTGLALPMWCVCLESAGTGLVHAVWMCGARPVQRIQQVLRFPFDAWVQHMAKLGTRHCMCGCSAWLSQALYFACVGAAHG